MSGIPVFAVVGCVNMGKSSLVATLTEQDWVPIDRRPGTTQRADAYDLTLDDSAVLTLIDTPGFQNARLALEWVEDHLHSEQAPTPPAAVRAFVEQQRHEPAFVNEVRLLEPVLAGAGIIYVVNASRPYQPRYAAEMRLLALTGAPRLAVLNLTEAGQETGEWREALSPFFKVTEFNALAADVEARLRLLASFAGVDDSWAPAVLQAVQRLRRAAGARAGSAASLLTDCLVDVLTASAKAPLTGDRQALRRKLSAELAQRLRQREQAVRRAVEECYRHRDLQRVEAGLPILDSDLLDRQSWRVLGLSRRQIVSASAAAGAAVGGVVDVGLGGMSFLTGTLIGAAIGSVAGLTGASTAADARVFGQRLGGDQLEVLPPDNMQFPFVVLDRALLHWRAVRQRAHARRDVLQLPSDEQHGLVRNFTPALRHDLAKVFARLQRCAGRSVDEQLRQRLGELVGRCLHSVDPSASQGLLQEPDT